MEDEYGRPQDFCLGHQPAEILEVVKYVAKEFKRSQTERQEWLGEASELTRADDLINADWIGPGFDFIGVGCNRVVMGLCLEHVVKIDFHQVSNANELAVWKNASEEVKEMLCPIFDSGDSEDVQWLLMGRCEPLGETEELEEAIHQKWDRLRGIWDLGHENWGFYRDRQVILDYGHSDPAEVKLEPIAMTL
jgi:hypothetical protein